jgi:two-component system response regulator FixJ
MTEITKLFLVDPDYRRRAAVAHDLASSSLHVEPFEDANDWPRIGRPMARCSSTMTT